MTVMILIEHAYKLQHETTEGTVVIEVEIEPLNIAYPVNSRFLLNSTLMGEFDGLFLKRVAVRDWKYPLKNSLQGEAILNFLRRRPKEDLDRLSRQNVLVLLNMKLKEKFRGRGLGVQILNKLIAHPSPDFYWHVAFGWARSYDGKSDKKHLNESAAKILAHYVKHLPNCVPWTDRSTFFLCVPGGTRTTNAAKYIENLPVL